MKILWMEFFKCRRRRIWLAPLLMLAAQLAWGLFDYSDMSEKALAEGWESILYQFPLLNAMITPVIAALVASRIADVEHKGQTLKLLYTVCPAGRLFDMKYLCAALYMTAMLILQTAAITVFGLLRGFSGAPPISRLAEYFVSALAVTLTILLIQFILSLKFKNQMIPFVVGLIGSFLGMFSLFFPQSIHKLLVWAYYGVLDNAAMDWNPDTRVVHYRFIDYDWTGLLCMLIIFAVVYIIGRYRFVREEV